VPEPGRFAGREWCGAWSEHARVTNPFGFEVSARIGLTPRRGAFDVSGLPIDTTLAPHASIDVPFELTGGSSRPGLDPLLHAHLRWSRGPGRAAGEILLDAPLVRTRTLVADALAQRVVLLKEAPAQGQATMTVRRHRGDLLVSIESPDGHRDARAIVRVEDRVVIGGRGVRVRLPADFDDRPEGIDFSCGFVAQQSGERVVRRFAGGVPDELGAGAPGRLVPLPRA
jgi:hypothetical protein